MFILPFEFISFSHEKMTPHLRGFKQPLFDFAHNSVDHVGVSTVLVQLSSLLSGFLMHLWSTGKVTRGR